MALHLAELKLSIEGERIITLPSLPGLSLPQICGLSSVCFLAGLKCPGPYR